MMKKTVSIAVAAAIAVSAMAVSAAPAAAASKGDRAAIAIFGAIAGMALSQAYHDRYYGNYYYGYPPPPPPRPYGYYGRAPGYYGGYGNAHVDWCLNRYRTYNPATNTYFRKPGVPAVCHSPFG